MELGKLPPQALDLEMAILGALLLEKDAFLNVSDILNKDDFYKEHHGVIYESICNLYRRNEPIDMLTVVNSLKNINKLEEVGGAFYVSGLTSNVASATNITHHAVIVKEKAVARQLIKFGNDTMAKAYEDTEGAIELARNGLVDIMSTMESDTKTDWASVVNSAIDTIQENNKLFTSGVPSGISTGFSKLDEFTAGWYKQNLIIFAGRPAMGKTSVMLHFIKTALIAKKKTMIYSLEMSQTELTFKLIGSSNVSPKRMRTGNIYNDEWEKMDRFIDDSSDWELDINDKGGISISQLEINASKMKVKKGLDIIFIDYLQLINNDFKGSVNDSVGDTSKRLKALAKKLDLPIVCLSQLSRAAGKDKRRPILTDLRDSGAIEQDADMVCFVHREHYYNPDMVELKGKGELIIAKNRHGEVGIMEFEHNEIFTKFWDDEAGQFQEENPQFNRYEKDDKPF